MSTLSNYLYELAVKSLNTVDPIPPAPTSPLHQEPAGSPYLCDWALDVRPTYKLTDAELVDKMRWELEALQKRERLHRVLEVPTVYPEAK